MFAGGEGRDLLYIIHPFFHFTFMLIYILAAASAHLEGDDWRGRKGGRGGADDVSGTITGRGTDLQYLLWK